MAMLIKIINSQDVSRSFNFVHLHHRYCSSVEFIIFPQNFKHLEAIWYSQILTIEVFRYDVLLSFEEIFKGFKDFLEHSVTTRNSVNWEFKLIWNLS